MREENEGRKRGSKEEKRLERKKNRTKDWFGFERRSKFWLKLCFLVE